VRTDPIDVKILGPGDNWMTIGGIMANAMTAGDLGLPEGSIISVATGVPIAKVVVEGPEYVARGDFHIGVTAPAWVVGMARDGKGPFTSPLPICSIATFPHDDRLVFAVRKESTLRSLREIRDRKVPLRVSMPPSAHTTGWMLDQLFEHLGFSREGLVAWGGEILDDRPHLMNDPNLVPVDPSFDAVFDEAIMTVRWEKLVEQYELRYLPLDDEARAFCSERGMVPGVLEKGRLRGVTEDIPTLDGSGWAMYCAEDLADDIAYAAAAALDRQKGLLSERFGSGRAMTSPLDMRIACTDVPVPLHPGAEAYYREQGYLG
jgi:hypothetical protein